MPDTYADIFAERGDSYHAAMILAPEARTGEFRALAERAAFAPGLTVADMPAGGGYSAAQAPAGMRRIFVEPSTGFLKRLPDGPDTEIVHAELHATGLPAAVADRVLSLVGLHHHGDLVPIFAEMRRLLKPGGRAVIADVDAGSRVAAFLNGWLDRHNSQGHRGRFFDGTTAATLSGAGFRILGDEVVAFAWPFDSRHQMGLFAKLLFGCDKADEYAVAAALEETVGTCDGPGKVNLAWSLRYITAEPA